MTSSASIYTYLDRLLRSGLAFSRSNRIGPEVEGFQVRELFDVGAQSLVVRFPDNKLGQPGEFAYLGRQGFERDSTYVQLLKIIKSSITAKWMQTACNFYHHRSALTIESSIPISATSAAMSSWNDGGPHR